jgi:hypothetical protein
MRKANWMWVVFDTSQYQKYYRDVHDLLALPPGWVLRYNYGETQMSAEALQMAEACGTEAVPALFLYGQKEIAYARDNNKSTFPEGEFPVRFVATRAGLMLNVIKDGNRYNFDFAVQDYPNQSPASIAGVLDPLRGKGEVPWNKWVAISDRLDLLSALKSGTAADNWTGIVQALGNPPMQFAGDAFWRLEGPFKEHLPLSPKIERIKNEARVTQVRSYLLMKDRQHLRFQLYSQTGGPVSATRPQYEVHVTSSQPKSLAVAGDGKFELRHYMGQSVDYESEAIPPLSSKVADLIFETKPDATWPNGALLKLRQKIRKPYTIQILGSVFGLASMALLVIGASDLFKNDALNGLILLLIGSLLGVLSAFLLTGKLQFKS